MHICHDVYAAKRAAHPLISTVRCMAHELLHFTIRKDMSRAVLFMFLLFFRFRISNR